MLLSNTTLEILGPSCQPAWGLIAVLMYASNAHDASNARERMLHSYSYI